MPTTNTIRRNRCFLLANKIGGRKEYESVRKATEEGTLVRVKQGVYASMESLANTMIDIEKIVPDGVLCLYSAWAYYNLTTQIPSAYCIAIEAKRKVVVPVFPTINLYYWKADYLSLGVDKRKISGYRVKITDLERSVCDAIKYRNKIGLDVCSEILREYMKRPDRNVPRLCDYARQLRVYNILSKYLEIMI